MKFTFSAILIGVLALTTAPASAASGDQTVPQQIPATEAPATLDERLGCGVMLVTLDEVLQRNPQLGQAISKGENGSVMGPMIRMLGASGELMLDQAYAEGATQGLKPTALYRRGVTSLSSAFSGIKSSTDERVKTQAMALFTRCVSIAAPRS
ncbi:hypothetical protein [Caulobacter sp.]|uniref:hypothetical protein n=1 Tax=Caulobacter sp. TaxID=78 RepID=UPI003BB14DD7